MKFPGGAVRMKNYKLKSWQESTLHPGPVTLGFISREDPAETLKYVYNVYVELYANLKQRCPDVPPLEQLRVTGWASHAKS